MLWTVLGGNDLKWQSWLNHRSDTKAMLLFPLFFKMWKQS